jgi:putative peptide zinc metalloprotease protein
MKNDNGNSYCIGSRTQDKYFFISERFLPDCLRMFTLMDGIHTLTEIKMLIEEGGTNGFDFDYAYSICSDNNLISNDTTIRKAPLSEFELLYKTLVKVDISYLSELSKNIKAPIFKLIVFLMTTTIFLGACVLIRRGIQIDWNFFLGNPIMVLLLLFTSTSSVLLHEFSHAFVASRFGLKVEKLSITTVAYTSIGAYVRVPGIYFLKPLHRIVIWLAGVFMNTFLLSIGIFLIQNYMGYISMIGTALVVSNFTLLYISIIPFYLSDGYFVMTTVLRVPNLRRNSLFNLKKILKEKKINNIGFLYVLYLLLSVIFTLYFIGKAIYQVGLDVFENINNQVSPLAILMNYKNIFIIIGVSILGRLLYIKFMQKGTNNNIER